MGLPAAMKLVADDVQTVVLPGTGHWVAEQAPEELLDVLTAFLAPTAIERRWVTTPARLLRPELTRLSNPNAASRQHRRPRSCQRGLHARSRSAHRCRSSLLGRSGAARREMQLAGSYAEMAQPARQRVPQRAKRELMPSFRKILRRCHSTVRGLRNSCAPICGFDSPSLASRATWCS